VGETTIAHLSRGGGSGTLIVQSDAPVDVK
jgi:hypothetical protein